MVEELRISKFDDVIKTTLVHIYPFIITENLENDIRLRVTGLWGTIRADIAAKKILQGVRRNEMEISIPKYFLYLGNILRLLPRKVVILMREFWDTGIDFA
jgi:all-trans-retinol dehydrogenase (NAD+)